ncbi:hypothetical protein HPB48_012742 [Haemaphysalis longicornis]|uniref:Peptidase M13 N-terminal domain-containing protein n=1 Tax=Haemaphysalis longicornis TaxID=44386 RepID=A0A9J6GDB9_HAELO|nr:hypothetical protein HPB48_012742 [Haemaphysalis longicornis]
MHPNLTSSSKASKSESSASRKISEDRRQIRDPKNRPSTTKVANAPVHIVTQSTETAGHGTSKIGRSTARKSSQFPRQSSDLEGRSSSLRVAKACAKDTPHVPVDATRRRVNKSEPVKASGLPRQNVNRKSSEFSRQGLNLESQRSSSKVANVCAKNTLLVPTETRGRKTGQKEPAKASELSRQNTYPGRRRSVSTATKDPTEATSAHNRKQTSGGRGQDQAQRVSEQSSRANKPFSAKHSAAKDRSATSSTAPKVRTIPSDATRASTARTTSFPTVRSGGNARWGEGTSETVTKKSLSERATDKYQPLIRSGGKQGATTIPGNVEAHTRRRLATTDAKSRVQISEAEVRPNGRFLHSDMQLVTIFVVVVVVATVSGVLIYTFLLSRKPSPPVEFCGTHECQEYVRLLTGSLNTSADPCLDFTRFVCGGWERENDISVHEYVYQRAVDKVARLVRTIEVPQSGQNSLQRAAAVYSSCYETLRLTTDGLPDVKKALLEAGITWPQTPKKVDLLRTLLYSSVKLGWDVIVHAVLRWSPANATLLLDPGRSFDLVVKKLQHPALNVNAKAYFGIIKKVFGAEDSAGVTWEDTAHILKR